MADTMTRGEFVAFLRSRGGGEQIARREEGVDLDARVDNFVLRFAGGPENVRAICIGITTTGVDGCWKQWNDRYRPGALGMAHMAIVYETTSYKFATKVKDRLIDTAYHDATHYPEIQTGNQGLPVKVINRDYTVYAAWTEDPEYQRPELVEFQNAFDEMTGHWNSERLGELTGIVNTIPDFNRETPFWIGITSDGMMNGCQNRWNTKYKFLRMNHMRILYRTRNDQYCRDAEGALIAYYRNEGWNIQNQGPGGEGRPGEEPFVVYIAWRI